MTRPARRAPLLAAAFAATLACGAHGALAAGAEDPVAGLPPEVLKALQAAVPRTLPPQPLYPGAVPNSIEGPDQEASRMMFGMLSVSGVSRPTLQAWLPAPERNTRTAIVLFPGGGYQMLSMELEGQRIAADLQDRGVAAIIVKYRLPSDATMRDKSIGPLQDAQQALRVVRARAAEWRIDPHRVGVMGFSAGGHLAATVSTHFDRAYVPNEDAADLRPDFSVLVYPVISVRAAMHPGSTRTALLGASPTPQQVEAFSNESQVTGRTPPALLIAATDDQLVDVDHSIAYYEALRHHKVAASLVLLPGGDHGFFHLAREQWMGQVWGWLGQGGWLGP